MAANQLIPVNKVLTRKSSLSNITPISSGPAVPTSKNYKLDKAKSLEKKANSCAKEHMKYVLKPGNNLVIEFSTAAYELSKQCLYDLLYSKDFEYAVEKRNNIDLDGANVDTCYKVFNKKADGSC